MGAMKVYVEYDVQPILLWAIRSPFSPIINGWKNADITKNEKKIQSKRLFLCQLIIVCKMIINGKEIETMIHDNSKAFGINGFSNKWAIGRIENSLPLVKETVLLWS